VAPIRPTASVAVDQAAHEETLKLFGGRGGGAGLTGGVTNLIHGNNDQLRPNLITE